MPWKSRQDARAYRAQWARQSRHVLLCMHYGLGERSRRVINGLGRAACAPDEKWCSWSQHRVKRAKFRVCRRNRDGLQSYCPECQDMANRVAKAHTRQRHRRQRGASESHST